ncbi:hypothetical protein BGZ65_011854, partial [Modicella reniformis]
LPGSLVNGEEYETVKIIYSGATDDTNDTKNDARISSIRNLLGLLSSARFYTLNEVVRHLSNLIKETSADDAFTTFIAHRWGPVFLRPPEETAVTMHDKHPQRMMRDMLKMTHQIFEPIRMSREEGNLTRSVTSRAPAGGLGRRRGGPLNRLSREIKVFSQSSNGNGHVDLAQTTGHSGVPSIAIISEPDRGHAAPDGGSGVGVGSSPAAGAGSGAGSGAGGAKLQRRLGPSTGRFSLSRGVSAPEMFTEAPAFKRRAGAANGAEGSSAPVSDGQSQEGNENPTPGLLNTTGLKHSAGGEKNSRSPLRQSIMATSTSDDVSEEEDEGTEKVEEKADSTSDTVTATSA